MSTWDFEARLRQALAPVEPPADLEPRLEMTLGSLVEMAADELEAWELKAMKDPRNWPRAALGPAAARSTSQSARCATPHARPCACSTTSAADRLRPGV